MPVSNTIRRHSALSPSLRSNGVNDRENFGNAVCGESALARVPTHKLLTRCVVNAIDFVLGNVAVNPLDGGPQVSQNTTGFLRHSLKLIWG